MVMIFSGGHISGGHYNPSVTLAVYLSKRDKISMMDMFKYWVAQILGGLIGAWSGFGLSLDKGIVPTLKNPGDSDEEFRVFGAEFLFTFALCWVVLNSATIKHNNGNSFFGLAIGFTVLTGAIAVGHISGGVFNPAVATGLFIMNVWTGGNYVSTWFIYYISGILAPICAAGVFYIANYTNEFMSEDEKIEAKMDGKALAEAEMSSNISGSNPQHHSHLDHTRSVNNIGIDTAMK